VSTASSCQWITGFKATGAGELRGRAVDADGEPLRKVDIHPLVVFDRDVTVRKDPGHAVDGFTGTAATLRVAVTTFVFGADPGVEARYVDSDVVLHSTITMTMRYAHLARSNPRFRRYCTTHFIGLHSDTSMSIAGTSVASTNNGRTFHITAQIPTNAPSGAWTSFYIESYRANPDGSRPPAGEDPLHRSMVGIYIP
jgi:hypothetical protein